MENLRTTLCLSQTLSPFRPCPSRKLVSLAGPICFVWFLFFVLICFVCFMVIVHATLVCITGTGTAVSMAYINTLRPGQNRRHFADDIFKRIFLNETIWIAIKISLSFVPMGSINNIPALVQIMAWRRPGGKPLSEPMMVSFLTHICVTRP